MDTGEIDALAGHSQAFAPATISVSAGASAPALSLVQRDPVAMRQR
jgi:hypothetical protein